MMKVGSHKSASAQASKSCSCRGCRGRQVDGLAEGLALRYPASASENPGAGRGSMVRAMEGFESTSTRPWYSNTSVPAPRVRRAAGSFGEVHQAPVVLIGLVEPIIVNSGIVARADASLRKLRFDFQKPEAADHQPLQGTARAMRRKSSMSSALWCAVRVYRGAAGNRVSSAFRLRGSRD